MTVTSLNNIQRDVLLFDTSAGNKTFSLPEAANNKDRVFTIKKTTSDANTVTVDANASETIDGALTLVLNNNNEEKTIICDGSNWSVIGESNDLDVASISVGTSGITSTVSNGIVPIIISAAQDNIAAGTGGAISITTHLTTIATDAGGDAFTLADGATVGQLKKIQLIVDGGGDATITPTNLNGGTTITMADVGDLVVLLWDGTGWDVIERSNDADGATAPVVA